MPGHVIEKTAYAQQAVREFMGGGKPSFPRAVRKKIDHLLKQMTEENVIFVDGIYHVGPALASMLQRQITTKVDGAVVDINPFTCDLIDLFRMIKGNDADQAKNRNGQGFNKPDSVLSRRLLGKIDSHGLHPGNVVEMYVIAHRYRKQAAAEISARTRMKLSEVSGILESRFRSNSIARSMRMVVLTDVTVEENVAPDGSPAASRPRSGGKGRPSRSGAAASTEAGRSNTSSARVQDIRP
jgi:hypothetical protein